MVEFSYIGGPARWRAGLGRLTAGAALLTAVALLPWLSGNDPALTVLRARSAGHLPQLLPTVVSLAGGAVAVEKIFNIPGLGRLALDSAIAQDLPPLQTATLALVLLGVVAGLLIQALRRALLGPALRDGALPALPLPGGASPAGPPPLVPWACSLWSRPDCSAIPSTSIRRRDCSRPRSHTRWARMRSAVICWPGWATGRCARWEWPSW